MGRDLVLISIKGLWLLLLATICIGGLVEFSHAQQLSQTLAGFSSDPDAPIDIESDRLEVDDNAKTATFTGSVKAVQGEFTLRSKVLVVIYKGGQGKGETSTEVTKLKASGKVLVTSGKDQSATSEWADFDVKAQLITLGGDVVVNQGTNVIRGEKLIVDLNTGRSFFESVDQGDSDSKKKSRIRMMITKTPKPVKKKSEKKSIVKQSVSRSSASPILRGPTSRD